MGEDIAQDHNKMSVFMYISYSLKTLKLIVLILNVSFFLGVLWLIFCEVSTDYMIDQLNVDPDDPYF